MSRVSRLAAVAASVLVVMALTVAVGLPLVRRHFRRMSSRTPTTDWLNQVPFELPDESMPQPDGAVYTPEQEARRPCPNAAVLIVEVADSSIELDQELADDYAAAGVPDYWIVNVRDHQIEVYRDPRPDPSSPTGHRYAGRRVYHTGESLAPLARPDAVVAVAALADVG